MTKKQPARRPSASARCTCIWLNGGRVDNCICPFHDVSHQPVTRAELDALMADLRVVAKKMIEMAAWFEDMSDIYRIAGDT